MHDDGMMETSILRLPPVRTTRVPPATVPRFGVMLVRKYSSTVSMKVWGREIERDRQRPEERRLVKRL